MKNLVMIVLVSLCGCGIHGELVLDCANACSKTGQHMLRVTAQECVCEPNKTDADGGVR